MKVILLEDVKGKGKKDSVIDVSDGYANNYLIKNKLAVLYTKSSKNILEQELQERKEQEEELIANLNKVKEKLENKSIHFKVNTGKSDRVFGNISSKQIIEKLKQEGYNIDKKSLKIENNIDTLGTHKIEIELHKKVRFSINIVLEK